MKLVYKYIFYIGLSLFVLSIIMFFTSVGLFTATGSYPELIIKLGEISIILWFPFLIIGIFLIIGEIGIYIIQKSK